MKSRQSLLTTRFVGVILPDVVSAIIDRVFRPPLDHYTRHYMQLRRAV